MGAGDAASASRVPIIFLISAVFHCALILAVARVNNGGGGQWATNETVIKVGLIGLADLAEAAPTPRDAGNKATGPSSQKELLAMPLRDESPDAEKGAADAKKRKNCAVLAKLPVKTHRSATGRGMSAAAAPVISTRPSVTSPEAVDLSRPASTRAMDSPPESQSHNAGKRGMPEAGPGLQKFSAAGRGTGGEDAKKGYLIENFLYIKNRITRHLSYPPVARRLKWQGIAVVTFCILENGLVENIKIASSSGHQLLDNHVIDTVKLLQPFPKPPARAEITIPVKYFLSE